MQSFFGDFSPIRKRMSETPWLVGLLIVTAVLIMTVVLVSMAAAGRLP
jgi:hypothetical protein